MALQVQPFLPNLFLFSVDLFLGKDNPLTISRKYSTTFICNFNLHLYPFDVQHCDMQLQMLSASKNYIAFDQMTSSAVLSGNKLLLEYEVGDFKAHFRYLFVFILDFMTSIIFGFADSVFTFCSSVNSSFCTTTMGNSVRWGFEFRWNDWPGTPFWTSTRRPWCCWWLTSSASSSVYSSSRCGSWQLWRHCS